MTAAPATPPTPRLEQNLDKARRRIEVSMPELTEARRRRDLLAAALRTEFRGCRIYVNGSVAHGDALCPLTDVDLGVVVVDPNHLYGPGKCGPGELKKRAARAIRDALKDEYPRLRVIVAGRKRSLLVSFGDPVTKGLEDFTADVIVAVDNPTGDGLYIPRYASWDRSHPEKHTELVRAAVESSKVSYSRVVRLLKHWSRRHDKPLCSWHIKALALGCLTSPIGLLAGMLAWFDHAIAELGKRETPDPAGVAPKPIKSSLPRTVLVAKLCKAREQLVHAIELDAAGWNVLALDELARFFNDEGMLTRPDQGEVVAQEIARRRAERSGARSGSPALITSARHREHTPTRSWAP